jgi:hypothetical protein
MNSSRLRTAWAFRYACAKYAGALLTWSNTERSMDRHTGTSAAGLLACNRRGFPAADQNEGDDNEIPAMSRQLAGESDFLIFVQAHTGFRFLAAQ